MPTPATTDTTETPWPLLPPTPDPYSPGQLIKLTKHPAGYWSKKRAGRVYYFARRDEPNLAITEYLRRWPEIVNPTPREASLPAEITLTYALGRYLDSVTARLERGEISWPRERDYRRIAQDLTEKLKGGRRVELITPVEWADAIADLYGHKSPVTRHTFTQNIKTMLGWVERNCGVSAKTGDALAPVPARIRRRHARERGPQLLTPGAARRILKACWASIERGGQSDAVTTEAAIWLALNGGMRQSEIAQLTPSAYRPSDKVKDGVRGWIDEPRPKTESPRRFPLWPETAGAIDRAVAQRTEQLGREAYAETGLLLTTREGTPLLTRNNDRLQKRFEALRRAAWPDPESSWRRCSWSWFRTTSITIAAAAPVSRPDLARLVRNLIAGHTVNNVHDAYIQTLPDEPFIETVLYVRRWLLEGQALRVSR